MCNIITSIWLCLSNGGVQEKETLAGTTCSEGLEPLFVHNFYRCIHNNHKIVQECEGDCGGNDGWVENGRDDFGGRDDANKKGGWNGAIKEKPYQIKTIIPKYKRT